MSNFPKTYDPAKIGDNYEPKLVEIAKEAKKAKLTPSSKDKKKTILIGVDYERDFVLPTGALSVAHATEDVIRLTEWLYRNVEKVTDICASLDTHSEMQIFHPGWWINMETKTNPIPFTVITFDDIVKGKWQALVDPIWSHHYVHELESRGQKNLVIWPLHCIKGTDGQKLVPAFAEAIHFHAEARGSKPKFLTKGTVPQVEHYGIFASEIPYPKRPETLLNTTYLDMISQYDKIYVAGEAKSHCVLETMKQMMAYFETQPDVIAKIHFLMDCTSSVIHPTIDFEAMAMTELTDMEKKGVVMIKSTDPLN